MRFNNELGLLNLIQIRKGLRAIGLTLSLYDMGKREHKSLIPNFTLFDLLHQILESNCEFFFTNNSRPGEIV